MASLNTQKILSASILFLFFFAILLFVFRGNIFSGQALLSGQAPFTAQVLGEGETYCETSPCEIRSRVGEKDILITKPGYQSTFVTANIALLRTQEITFELKIDPYLRTVSEIPELTPGPNLTIIPEGRKQKLIYAEDPTETAIVYFNSSIGDPTIIANKNRALIIEQSDDRAYLVDLNLKTRSAISDFPAEQFLEGLFSPRGQQFLFRTSEDPSLKLLSNNLISKTDLNVALSQLAWQDEQNLIFVTELNGAFDFQVFNTENLATESIFQTVELDSLPVALIPLSNGNQIYVKTQDNLFSIVLSQ